MPAARAGPWLDRAVAAFLAIGAAAYLLPLRHSGLMLVDDGWTLQPVMRMRAGEILYRDIWTYYAPGIHHLIAWLFDWTGPSVGAARTLYGALVVASVVLTYCFTRRFAPPLVAALPAAVYALVPGPWHKAYYGTLGMACFVALARALERPTPLRYGVLGAVAGVALVTRQDVGCLGLAIGLAAAALPALRPAAFGLAGDAARGASLRGAAAVVLGFALPVVPTAAWYAAHGALGPLLEATFVAALRQSRAHPDVIWEILGKATLAPASEGPGVAAILVLPLVLYPVAGVVLLGRLRRDGVTVDTALRGALLAFAAATLTQAWWPFLLLRFLQSALPFYVIATITACDAAGALHGRGRAAAAAPIAALAGAAAVFVGLVWFGLPRVAQPIYTGSLRMLRYTDPVVLWGERVYDGFEEAEEIRLVRAFFDHVPPGEPTVGFPQLSTYNLLLDRPNPTAWIGEHPRGNYVLSAEQKRAQAARLLASPARFVLVDQQWWARLDARDPMLETLRSEFHPVRGYGAQLVLQRGNDPGWRAFAELLRRAIQAGPRAADIAPLRSFAAAHPDEPLVWRLLALTLEVAGMAPGAIDANHRAAELDPSDVAALESSAALLLRLRRTDEARADLERARAVRESPSSAALAQRLGAASDAGASERRNIFQR